MILYTCESGKQLQEAGECFYASKKPDGSHVLPLEVAKEHIGSNMFAVQYDIEFIRADSQVIWLPQ